MTKKHTAGPLRYETDFVRVGDRDYIQGIAIAQAIAEAALSAHGAGSDGILFVDVAKFPRKTPCNGMIHIVADDAEPDLVTDAACILHGRWADGGRVFGAFIPNPNDPVRKNIENDKLVFSDPVKTGRFSGESDVKWRNLTEFFKTLVEVNKRTILKSLNPVEGLPVIEIVYVKNFSVSTQAPEFDGKLIVRNIGERDFGPRRYVLNVLSWPGLDGEDTIEMAFSLEPASD